MGLSDPNAGLNPKSEREFQRIADEAIEKRKVDIRELYAGECSFGDPGCVVQAWRVINRSTVGNRENAMNTNNIDLGLIQFDHSGPASINGTTDQQGLTRWLAGHRKPDSEFVADYPLDGRAEIEIKTSRGWLNCKTGEPNREIIFRLSST